MQGFAVDAMMIPQASSPCSVFSCLGPDKGDMLSAHLPWGTEQAPQLPAPGRLGRSSHTCPLTHGARVSGGRAGKMVVAAGVAKDEGAVLASHLLSIKQK